MLLNYFYVLSVPGMICTDLFVMFMGAVTAGDRSDSRVLVAAAKIVWQYRTVCLYNIMRLITYTSYRRT